jgi:cytochrome c peroxidase
MTRKFTYSLSIALVITSAFMALSCEKKSEEPGITLGLPPHFPAVTYNLNNNPFTPEGFKLGKMLFFEGELSRDGSISCGSCHNPPSAFTQHGHDLSHGIDDKLGFRNSLPTFNLLWHKTFMWDGGIHNMDFAGFNAITNPVEMDESLENVVQKLRNNPKYVQAFEKAFPGRGISSITLGQALSQYMMRLISAGSRYDNYVLGNKNALDADELAGLQLVRTKCTPCHAGELFTDHSFRNNGLSGDNPADKGHYEISLNPMHIGTFRVPTLRNLTYTAPYMHDGRFTTLKQVLDHYSDGMKPSATIDPTFTKEDGKLGIPLSESEKQQIIKFLKALDDPDFVKDRLFTP